MQRQARTTTENSPKPWSPTVKCAPTRQTATTPVIYGTMEGKIPLSTDQENLTINAFDAEACGFSIGTADTEEELAKILGLPRWYETTDDGRRIHKNWHKTLERAQASCPTSSPGHGHARRWRGPDQGLAEPTHGTSQAHEVAQEPRVQHDHHVLPAFPPFPWKMLEIREKEMSEQLARLRAAQRN